MGIFKLLAVLIAVLWMAALESVQPKRVKEEEEVALFVGSAHALPEAGSARLEQTF
jgi:hypothetical protein